MNLMNKLMEKRKTNNKGFSLVELIIVIAIMAILVGIVGTQVLPYLERSKESKDLQIVNSYSTAAMTSYTSNAGKLTATTGEIKVDVYGTNTGDAATLAPMIKELTYTSLPKGKMTSKTGKNVSKITIVYDLDAKTITTTAVGTTLDAVNADL